MNIGNLATATPYQNSLGYLAQLDQEADELTLADINELKTRPLTSADKDALLDSLLYFADKTEGESELTPAENAIYEAILNLLERDDKVAVRAELLARLEQEWDDGDNQVNETLAAEIIYQEISGNTLLRSSGSILATELAPATTASRELAEDSTIWNHITQTNLSAGSKQRLNQILLRSCTTAAEAQRKLSDLIKFFKQTLGWSDEFIAIALSDKYLLRDIDYQNDPSQLNQLSTTSFNHFVHSEIIAFENTIMKEDNTFDRPLYTYTNFRVVDGTPGDFGRAQEYLESEEALSRGFVYNQSLPVAYNIINYAQQFQMQGVWDEGYEFLLWNDNGTLTENKVNSGILNLRSFIDQTSGRTVVNPLSSDSEVLTEQTALLTEEDVLLDNPEPIELIEVTGEPETSLETLKPLVLPEEPVEKTITDLPVAEDDTITLTEELIEITEQDSIADITTTGITLTEELIEAPKETGLVGLETTINPLEEIAPTTSQLTEQALGFNEHTLNRAGFESLANFVEQITTDSTLTAEAKRSILGSVAIPVNYINGNTPTNGLILVMGSGEIIMAIESATSLGQDDTLYYFAYNSTDNRFNSQLYQGTDSAAVAGTLSTTNSRVIARGYNLIWSDNDRSLRATRP